MGFLSFIDQVNIIKDKADRAAGGDITTLVKERSITSLAEFARPSLIESPCFIHSAVIEEPVVNDVIKNLYNIYIGYILVALQMNNLVVGNRRVRDILQTVSTAGSYEFLDSVKLIHGLVGSLESADKNDVVSSNQRHSPDKVIAVPIASGRQIEVQFATDKGGNPINVLINIKFNPRIISDPVVEYILSPDYTNTLSNRWLQYQAGEIRFFKDFVLGIDKLNRKAKALKADKDNALQDIFRHQNRGKFEQMLKAAGQSNSHNLANSILILDNDMAVRYMKKNGFSFDKMADRKRFFDTTFNLFIVLVDTRYSRVTIYTNGIDQSATYSFNELKASGASDKMSLKDIMDLLAKSQMPKF